LGGDRSIPPLDGKPENAFVDAMRRFRTKQRNASVMNRIAAGYRDEDIANMATYFRSRNRGPR
jgi:cytochrome c553